MSSATWWRAQALRATGSLSGLAFSPSKASAELCLRASLFSLMKKCGSERRVCIIAGLLKGQTIQPSYMRRRTKRD